MAMNPEILLWLILMIGLGVAEAATVGLVTIWFAAGALAALLLAIIGLPLVVQVIAFVLVSVVLLIMTRPLARRYLHGNKAKTNVARVIGERAIVTEEVNNLKQTGRAMVLGQDWSIRAECDNIIIEPGTLVEVTKVSGVKLIVTIIKED